LQVARVNPMVTSVSLNWAKADAAMDSSSSDKVFAMEFASMVMLNVSSKGVIEITSDHSMSGLMRGEFALSFLTKASVFGQNSLGT